VTWVHLTPKSNNAKTGPIPVSTTEARTCPPSCPWREKVCYAKHGPLGLHWRAVSERKRGMAWAEFCETVRAFPEGTLWRHNQSGDLPGEGESIDAEELSALVSANQGKKGFTYTHKRGKENFRLIRSANLAGFTVNLSANSLEDADTLAETGAGPVCVVLALSQSTNTLTPSGRKVVICPATQREGVTCESCKLCSRADRSCIIGFPAHGIGRKGVTA
jgi:hypothetical protein